VSHRVLRPSREAEALPVSTSLRDAPALVGAAPISATQKRLRRVRANAATANLARFDAAFAARDADAIAAHVAFGEDMDHDTGAIYEARAMLPTFLSLMRAQDGTYRTEPLATLGDVLALSRQWASASGIAGGKFDVGAYEVEHILLTEVDAQGQHRRGEIFALNRLGDAVVRLYERYADLLPDGPERARAAATARSVAAYVGPFDPDRYATAFAPAMEVVDHRILATWSARGAEAGLQNLRALAEVSDEVSIRIDAILDLRSDALLVHRTSFGTIRTGGGAFERQYLALWIFGIDGLVTRHELFDADRDAEALARFDELVGSPVKGSTARRPPARIENAATRAAALMIEAWNARDWERVAALLPAGFRNIDRRKMMQVELDREQFLEGGRSFPDGFVGGNAGGVLATAAIDWRCAGPDGRVPIATPGREVRSRRGLQKRTPWATPSRRST
jgi:hypothetical protein